MVDLELHILAFLVADVADRLVLIWEYNLFFRGPWALVVRTILTLLVPYMRVQVHHMFVLLAWACKPAFFALVLWVLLEPYTLV